MNLKLYIAILQGRTKYGVYPHPWRERVLSKKHDSFREGIREEYGEDTMKMMDWIAGKIGKTDPPGQG